MRRLYYLAILGIVSVTWAVPAPADVKSPQKEGTCGEYGTSVEFENSPSDAARKALKAEKLVMVLHVSGDFEDPDFT